MSRLVYIVSMIFSVLTGSASLGATDKINIQEIKYMSVICQVDEDGSDNVFEIVQSPMSEPYLFDYLPGQVRREILITVRTSSNDAIIERHNGIAVFRRGLLKLKDHPIDSQAEIIIQYNLVSSEKVVIQLNGSAVLGSCSQPKEVE